MFDLKLFDVIFVIIGIIALVGSVGVAYVLVLVGATMSQLNQVGSSLMTPEIQQGLGVFNTVLLVGWILTICFFLSSLYTIWVGIQRTRVKKK